MAAPRRKAPGRTAADLRRELKSGEPRPVYLLEGEDTLRVAAVVDYLRDRLLGEAGAAFNFHRYDGSGTPLATVLQQALSYPMMCPHQVLWLKRVDEAVGDADGEEAMLRYLQAPSEQTVLVMSAVKVDGRRKWVKACKDSGAHYAFDPPGGADLLGWLAKAARDRDLALDPDVAALLVDLVGDDLHALSGELDKLALLAGESDAPSTAAELAEVILAQRAVDPFALVKELGPGQAASGLKSFHRFLAEGRSAYELAPLLVWRVKQVAMIAAYREEGLDDAEIMRRAGMSRFAFQPAGDAARRWGGDGVRRAVKACARCDADLKSSPLGPEKVLERAILEICAAS